MKTKFSNHEAVRLQFMTQSVNSLLSGENCLKQRKSTYDKRFIRYHKCFLLKLRYGAHANGPCLFVFRRPRRSKTYVRMRISLTTQNPTPTAHRRNGVTTAKTGQSIFVMSRMLSSVTSGFTSPFMMSSSVASPVSTQIEVTPALMPVLMSV